MPDKHLPTLLAIWDALPEPIRAAAVAWVVALLRVFYDGREPRIVRRVLEATLCGAVTYGVSFGAEAIGLAQGASIFIGGMLGLFGADWVRTQAQKLADRRIDEATK